MRDPLKDFDWNSLIQRYDAQCIGFDNTSVFLSALHAYRPENDRALYKHLLYLFSKEQRESIDDPIGIYEGLLYWKLYSQRTVKSNLNKWLRQDTYKRQKAKERLLQLFQEIPTSLERSPSDIVDLVERLGKFQLPGIASPSTLPVRTTFLHFLFPDVVPIFDKMVLKAVDSWEDNANHRVSVLKAYLPFVWELADRYAPQFHNIIKESPIRVIDMALWVCRGRNAISNPANHLKAEQTEDFIPKQSQDRGICERMTNHERFASIFSTCAGQKFTTAEITKIMLDKTDIKRGSILPNDHGNGNKGQCKCVGTERQIFDRIGKSGDYRVRKFRCNGSNELPTNE